MSKAAKSSRPVVRAKRRRLAPDERRREIIAQATEFFAEHGFSGVTRELARQLGIAQPLLYRYFPSKDHLIKEVYRTVYLERWDPAWDALLADRSRPLIERLKEFYRAYTDVIFTRKWMRIYLFSGLKGLDINRWYLRNVVQPKILVPIVNEYRHQAGLPAKKPTLAEIELAWAFHDGIFYYGVRKVIYEAPVLRDKEQFIAMTLNVFLKGIAQVYGTGAVKRAVTTSSRSPRREAV